jgi:hypothetical protein
MDWVSYRIEWAVIDVGFGSIVVCYDPKCLKWLKCNLNRCVYKLLDTFLKIMVGLIWDVFLHVYWHDLLLNIPLKGKKS